MGSGTLVVVAQPVDRAPAGRSAGEEAPTLLQAPADEHPHERPRAWA
jgi:hypothetical protein